MGEGKERKRKICENGEGGGKWILPRLA